MWRIFKLGQGSVILRGKIRRLSTGNGFTGLNSTTAGMIIATICDVEATTTAYTVAGSTIESIATLGTYAAPTATNKCRFKEVDPTNHPGLYEIQLANARFAVTGAMNLHLSISGVTDMVEVDQDIGLWQLDPFGAFGTAADTLVEAVPDFPGKYRLPFYALERRPGFELVNGMPASDMIGQGTSQNFTGDVALHTASGLTTPEGLAYSPADNWLFVSEFGNNRILVLDVTPGAINRTAIHVLGQADFTTITANAGGLSASSLSGPMQLAWDGVHRHLWCADENNNRTLKYDLSSGLVDHQAAVVVLGQAGFTTNSTGLTSTTMNHPSGVDIDTVNDRLFVGDGTNDRVMVWNSASSRTSGAAADNVLGQSSFTTHTAGPTINRMAGPQAVVYNARDDWLMVSEGIADRITIWDTQGIVNGMNASFVLGVPDFNSTGGNAQRQDVFWVPGQMGWDPVRRWLYVPEADAVNARTTVWDLSNQIRNGMFASYVLGQGDFGPFRDGTISQNIGGPAYAAVVDTVNDRVFISQSNVGGRVVIYQLRPLGVDPVGVKTLLSRVPSTISDLPTTVAAVWAQAMTELTGIPAVTGTVLQALEFVFLYFRNERRETATNMAMRNAANSSNIGSATMAEDGTTLTKGAFS